MDFIRDAFAQTIEILHDLPYQGTRTYKGDQASVLVTFFLESRRKHHDVDFVVYIDSNLQ